MKLLANLSRQQRHDLRTGLLFISPWIIGFLAFAVYPLLASFYFSFTDFNIMTYTARWTGFNNYVSMFTRERLFWISLQNTLRFAGMMVIFCTALDILAAFLLNQKVRGLSVYRTMLYLPVMTPTVAAALAWVWILNPKHGLINNLLAAVGIQGPYWLASPETALLSIVLVGVWASGRSVLVYLAGIQDVPTHLYEAAEIDGASGAQKMLYLTLPLITPQMLFNVITLIIFSLQDIAGPLIMTGGGPNNATLLFGLHLYRRAFQDMRLGVASAMGWFLFIVILLLTLLLFWGSQKLVVYDR